MNFSWFKNYTMRIIISVIQLKLKVLIFTMFYWMKTFIG